MKGDYVIVKSFGGRPLIRRVWDSTEDVVFVCAPERYQDLVDGLDARYPIGFPRENVFKYDESIAGNLDALWQVTPEIWDSLTMWEEEFAYA